MSCLSCQQVAQPTVLKAVVCLQELLQDSGYSTLKKRGAVPTPPGKENAQPCPKRVRKALISESWSVAGSMAMSGIGELSYNAETPVSDFIIEPGCLPNTCVSSV